MRPALIVIDVQESFRHRPYWREQDGDLSSFISNLQKLIDACVASRIPIVQIFHEDGSTDPNSAFSRSSGCVRTLSGIEIAPDALFHKRVHSSLFATDEAGLSFERWLRDSGIDTVLITGIRTEQCCETTARHASDSGHKVRFVTEATLTFPMRHASGREFSAEDIRLRTELVLADRFARIVTVENALA